MGRRRKEDKQEERKVVENVMGWTEEKRKGDGEMNQGRESKKVVDAVKDWAESEAQDSARRTRR